jgi:polyribonucleotide nucleotidyltransferase
MGPGRREIGHGALAERSIEPMLPMDEYPYAVRITSEIMESNGSTSMASVCAGSLALMDAGIPLKRPVAGISVGICTEYNDQKQISRYKLLTDIIGWEDAFCDMDCKIAGTDKGITGFQLDLKLKGLPHKIMAEALAQAKTSRLKIVEHMKSILPEPRAEISQYAPRIKTVKINPEKIGALIGPGGKNIKRLVEESGCEINIEDDGSVHIYSVSGEGMDIALREIEGMTAEAEIGKVYKGRVVTIKEFGCFVEFLPGRDGLCHISELANFRVKKTEDIVKMGLERERAQYGHQRTQTAISFGATVLGTLFGRKLGGATSVGRATTTARAASRTARERGDIARAEAQVDEKRQALAALDAEFEEALGALEAPRDPADFEVTEVRIPARKSDVTVERLALAWRPRP